MRAVFPIRLAIVEKAKICRAAVLRKLSPSAYVRWAALKQADRDLAPQAEKDSFSRENLGAGLRGSSRQRTPPRRRDEDEPRERPLSRAEQEEILGRPLADGLTSEQYKELTGGLGLGGDIRE